MHWWNLIAIDYDLVCPIDYILALLIDYALGDNTQMPRRQALFQLLHECNTSSPNE